MANEISPGAGGLASVAHNVGDQKTHHWFKRSIATVDIDDGDETRVLYGPFAENTLLDPNSLLIEVSDVAASALVWDFGVGDDDGTIDTAIITGSVVGVTAGHDVADDATAPYIDVSEKYLIFECTTGAVTPAAGTFEVHCDTIYGRAPETFAMGSA